MAVAAKDRSFFTSLAQLISSGSGKPATFFCALALIVVWGLSGPAFGFNETWQLIVNTLTTIITFLMVFVIQNSQNRDTAAMHIKLDELIAKLEGPREELLDLEQLDQGKLEAMRKEFCARAQRAREKSSNLASAAGG